VIVIKRIHAAYRLEGAEADRETVQRVHDMHKEHCPVYRSICRAIDITTSFELVAG